MPPSPLGPPSTNEHPQPKWAPRLFKPEGAPEGGGAEATSSRSPAHGGTELTVPRHRAARATADSSSSSDRVGGRQGASWTSAAALTLRASAFGGVTRYPAARMLLRQPRDRPRGRLVQRGQRGVDDFLRRLPTVGEEFLSGAFEELGLRRAGAQREHLAPRFPCTPARAPRCRTARTPCVAP